MTQPWHRDQRPVVAGVDGSQRARTAAQWAAAEAALRGVPLHLVHSSPPPPSTAVDVPSPRGSAGPAAQHLLHDTRQACLHAQPSLTAHTHLEIVPAATALVRWSAKAQLVVVGHHGVSSFTGLMVGSVCAALGERARCPVVVVRSSGSMVPVHRGPVVVGLSGSAGEDTVIDFAFAAAARARCALIALRSWWTDLDEDFLGGLVESAPDVEHRDIPEQVSAALSAAQREHPGVPTSIRVVHAPRGPTLLEEVRRSHPQLLVLAANDRGVRQGLLGPTARTMLHRAACPVAIVAPARRPVTTAALPGRIDGQL
jgi:nucleotide-binding universal stress UspA family protein